MTLSSYPFRLPAALGRSSLRLLLALLLATQSLAAFAQSSMQSTEHVDAALISRSTHVMPGQVLDLALRLQPEKGWHTYWKNPGDTGLPTKITWTLPDGFKPGDIQWPVPEWIDYEGLTNFGFHGDTWLLVPVAVPFELPSTANGAVRIEAKAKWLVCREVCIPEQAEFALELPVAPYAEDSKQFDSEWADDFARAWTRTPPLREDIHGEFGSVDGLLFRIDTDKLPVMDRPPRAFIADRGLASNTQPPTISLVDKQLIVRAEPDPYSASLPDFSSVVLAWGDGEATRAIEVPVKHNANIAGLETAAAQVATPEAAIETAAPAATHGLLKILLFALLGGLILNAMPCVFPVLSLKVISLVESGNHSAAERKLHGLAYTAGVILSFLLVAAVLIALRAAGEQIGWGFQLQSPWFIGALVYLLFLLGLSMSGFFELGSSLQGLGSGFFSDDHPWRNSFLTGCLATVVATPCTAPFMGTAMGFALSQPAVVALLVFAAMGLGLALPFLLIAFVPALAAALPSPGQWMVRLKEFLAFPIYLTVVWLLWVFSRQAGGDAVSVLLVGMVLIAFALWLWRSTTAGGGEALSRVVAGISLLLAIALLVFGSQLGGQVAVVNSSVEKSTAGQAESQPYSAAGLQAAIADGKIVLTNMTADWCITCKVNERVALKSDAVQAVFARDDVVYMKGDWTNSDPAITAYLESFQRNGVPLYVVYQPGAEPRLLPQLLTPELVVNALTNP